MSRTFRRGYNAALRAVRRSLGGWNIEGGMSAEQTATLGAVVWTCRRMRLPARTKPRLDTLAREYAVSLRTIKNWKREGCPFAKGRRAVLGWMLQRRTLPAGPKQKFTKELLTLSIRADAADVRRAAKGMSAKGGDAARCEVGLRVNGALRRLAELDGSSLLRHGREFHTLTKIAKRVFRWE